MGSVIPAVYKIGNIACGGQNDGRIQAAALIDLHGLGMLCVT
jgi:hypothetical protein